MILYKTTNLTNTRKRPIKTISMEIEERPERPIYSFRNAKDRQKFICHVEALVRRSDEYKGLMKFLKANLDMGRCTVLKNIKSENGKRYSIEIHHEPFTLKFLVDIVLTKFESEGEEINPFLIADEIMMLHYDQMVGLVPLSKTIHELVHSDKIFIPLQLIYQGYGKFYEEYESYISDKIKEVVELKVNLSMKCGDILSDVLDPEFVYVDVQGMTFPEIPKEWKDIMNAKNEETE